MRIVGETILLVSREGGWLDADDNWIPETIVNIEIHGAVFIPESTGTIHRNDGTLQYREASLLLPQFEQIDTGAEIKVRGESYRVDRPSVEHRSAFGTKRGGTEVFLRRVSAG